METMITDYQKRDFEFTGETFDGEEISGIFPDMTIFRAKHEARKILKTFDGGHIDIWDTDGAFLCDVEV